MTRTSMSAWLVAMAVLSAGTAAWAQTADTASVMGKVDAVTVYRGQALVTRAVQVPGTTAGLVEFVVTNLPDRVQPESLFAEGVDGVEVRSIRFRTRPVGQDIRDDVRKLDEDIRKVQDGLTANQRNLQLLSEERMYMERLGQFTAATSSTEMTKGVLNAETLKTVTEFQFKQRQGLVDQELKLQTELKNLNQALELLQRQREQVTNKSAKTIQEAVIFVSQPAAKGSVRVRYLVDQASWSPSYNIRADADRKTAKVEYQASIAQMSGEDWTDVAMTLSTATPSLVANAPRLSPLSIALVSRPAGGSGLATDGIVAYGRLKQELASQQRTAEAARNIRGNGMSSPPSFDLTKITQSGTTSGGAAGGGAGGGLFTDNAAAAKQDKEQDAELNKVADQIQVLELVAKKADETTIHNDNEGIVVTYQLASRTSLPSREDRQLIQITAVPVKANFYKIAVPVLTNYVYDEASLTNTSNLVLLAGPVSSYQGGQFVGNGEISTVAVGQTFNVGFGIDPALRAMRERLDRTETVQGGNRVANYTYRIAIDNFGAAAVDVRVMDRLPTSKESEVKVQFTDAPATPLSADKEYQQFSRPKGILRWDVAVPPQKNGAEAFSLTYKLNMEYDKNASFNLSDTASMQKLQEMMNH